MSPRRLLDSFSIADSRPLWSYLHTGTLLRLISFICHSYANTRGVGVFFPFWNALRGHTEKNSLFIQVLSFHTLAHSFARTKTQLFYFQALPHFLRKNTRGWGIPSTPRGAKYKPGDASGLLIDVVFGFQALQQRLEKWLVRLGRSADRLRHFLSGRREITLVRRDPGQGQVADPMIRILVRNLRIQFKSALGVPRSLKAASVGVQLIRAGRVERLGTHFGGFFLFSHDLQDARLGLQIFKPLFILDRGVFPLQRLLQFVIVVQAPLRRLVVSAPCESADAPQFVLDALQHHRFHVHGNAEGTRQFFPEQRRQRGIRLHVIENVRQHFKRFRGVRFDAHAQRIFFLVVAEAAPRSRVLRKYDRPLIFVRERVQPVRPRTKRFPFNGNIIGKRNCRIFVRARAPHFSKGHGLAPNLPPAHFRPVIRNDDVRQPNPLRNRPALADARNVQLRRLPSVLKLRASIPRPNSETHHHPYSKLRHIAHIPTS